MSNTKSNTRDIIIKLKEVREERGLSYTDILNLMEKNNDFLAKSTISRVFADGSEEMNFRYEETIRPIAKALLDIETIEDNDDMNVQAMKSLLKYQAKTEIYSDVFALDIFANLVSDFIKMNAEVIERRKKLDQMRDSIAQKLHNAAERTKKVIF